MNTPAGRHIGGRYTQDLALQIPSVTYALELLRWHNHALTHLQRHFGTGSVSSPPIIQLMTPLTHFARAKDPRERHGHHDDAMYDACWRDCLDSTVDAMTLAPTPPSHPSPVASLSQPPPPSAAPASHAKYHREVEQRKAQPAAANRQLAADRAARRQRRNENKERNDTASSSDANAGSVSPLPLLRRNPVAPLSENSALYRRISKQSAYDVLYDLCRSHDSARLRSIGSLVDYWGQHGRRFLVHLVDRFRARYHVDAGDSAALFAPVALSADRNPNSISALHRMVLRGSGTPTWDPIFFPENAKRHYDELYASNPETRYQGANSIPTRRST